MKVKLFGEEYLDMECVCDCSRCGRKRVLILNRNALCRRCRLKEYKEGLRNE